MMTFALNFWLVLKYSAHYFVLSRHWFNKSFFISDATISWIFFKKIQLVLEAIAQWHRSVKNSRKKLKLAKFSRSWKIQNQTDKNCNLLEWIKFLISGIFQNFIKIKHIIAFEISESLKISLRKNLANICVEQFEHDSDIMRQIWLK